MKKALLFFGKPALHIALIAALGLIVYSNTFNVPFQMDEGMTIVDNPIVKDLDYFAHPSKAKGFMFNYYSFRDRYMGYLSFALNYKIHGLDVRGYHVVNITLHILNSLLVYALVGLTLRTVENLNPSRPPLILREGEGGVIQIGDGGGAINPPLEKGDRGGFYANHLSLFVALLFVSHPIQTEAVTYVMGRLPLLMWFFYLSAMVLYARWRLDTPLNPSYPPLKLRGGEGGVIQMRDRGGLLYFASLLCAVLAMKTKENALTLPLSIALYEFMFFPSPKSSLNSSRPPLNLRGGEGGVIQKGVYRRLIYLIPFMLTLLIIPLSLLSFDKPIGEVVGGIESALRHYTEIPRMSYFFTQFRVLVTYLRLLFLPINQNFGYDYPVYNSFFNPQVLISLMFLLSIFALGVFFLIRSKRGNPSLRLLAWGVFWFFLTLSVESSVFPIPVIISEYRLYAPSMGIILAVVAALIFFVNAQRSIAFLAAMVIVLSGAAYARNIIWGSGISLWKDVVRKSPQGERGHFNLSKLLLDAGDIDRAIQHLQIAISLKPDYADAHNNLGSAYKMKGLMEMAKAHYQFALSLEPDFAEAHYNLGLVYHEQGLVEMARREFETALQIYPNYREARQWLNYIAIQNEIRLPNRHGIKKGTH